jgi:hypothetical protein
VNTDRCVDWTDGKRLAVFQNKNFNQRAMVTGLGFNKFTQTETANPPPHHNPRSKITTSARCAARRAALCAARPSFELSAHGPTTARPHYSPPPLQPASSGHGVLRRTLRGRPLSYQRALCCAGPPCPRARLVRGVKVYHAVRGTPHRTR